MKQNTNVKVSVIIAVYNAEKYLRECLDSILNQEMQEIEIICVNDGSTDNSTLILEEYKARDSRVRVLTQRNQGAGAARNYAYLRQICMLMIRRNLNHAHGLLRNNIFQKKKSLHLRKNHIQKIFLECSMAGHGIKFLEKHLLKNIK